MHLWSQSFLYVEEKKCKTKTDWTQKGKEYESDDHLYQWQDTGVGKLPLQWLQSKQTEKQFPPHVAAEMMYNRQASVSGSCQGPLLRGHKDDLQWLAEKWRFELESESHLAFLSARWVLRIQLNKKD